jgi:hypothetical protein
LLIHENVPVKRELSNPAKEEGTRREG